MSSLLFLTDKDFDIGDGARGKLLFTKIRGVVLVFFSATGCEICQQFLPEYKQLPKYVAGCQFAHVNLTSYPKIIRMSRETIMPLTEVPYIVLYINGKPVLRYDDAYDINIIGEFVASTIRKLQGQIDETSLVDEADDESNSIPAYSIGRPKKGGSKEKRGVCYIGFDGAYRKKELPPENDNAKSSLDGMPDEAPPRRSNKK